MGKPYTNIADFTKSMIRTREEAGLTWEDVNRQTGIPIVLLRDIETKGIFPDWGTITRLVILLRIELINP